ncbi:hypothetical protein KJ641_03755 [Patescibacteria group bacterium]|nr:hypothetical protein [Patescibacteria group bacterium]
MSETENHLDWSPFIISYEANLRNLITGLEAEQRWKEKRHDWPQLSSENVFQHTFKGGMQAILLLAIEFHLGNQHQLDPFIILSCALRHDFGESDKSVGDKCLTDKTADDEAIEDEAFWKIRRRLVPEELWQFFRRPLDRTLDIDQIHRRFWQAVENIGYIMFALEEMKRPNEPKEFRRDLFVQICEERRPTLEEHAEMFISIRIVAKALYHEIDTLMLEDNF